jgi:multidrug efflux pump subunit AcrB
MLFLLATLVGLYSFRAMQVQNFPDIELPIVTVTTTLPGATPNQLENEVARKLENSLATVQGVKHIYTTISDSVVTIRLEFYLEVPIETALDDTRSAVDKVRSDLPTTVEDPIVNKVDLSGGSPILAFTVSAPNMDEEALSWYVDNTITKMIIAINGVGAVTRVGGVDRQIRIDLDPLRIQALGTTAADISHQLAQVEIERAAGKAKIGGSDRPLRTLATVSFAQELRDLRIPLSDGRQIRLKDVATITDGIAEPTAAAFLDGKPVVGFEITRTRGAGAVEVGQLVRDKLTELQKTNPELEITESFDFVTPVIQTYDGSMELLYEGALLAILVVWLFLRDLRATFIAAVALPLSAIPAFFGMYLMGFTLNIVTLLALSLCIGILVDDAIVEVENIVRHMRMGKTPFQAALEAADEIGLAVVSTSFTLIAVFLPTAFMTGIVGRFFKQFGWTATLAIFSSLVVARLLTPMMAAYILKPITQKTTNRDEPQGLIKRLWVSLNVHPIGEPGWLKYYLSGIQWCVKYRWLTFISGILFFVASLMIIPLLPKGFVPADDSSQTQVTVELDPGSTLDQTKVMAEQARRILENVQHVKSIYTTIGAGAAGSDPFNPSQSEPRKAVLTIQLDPREERPRKQVIEQAMRQKLVALSGVRTKVGLGGSGEKYQLVLTSTEPLLLQKAAQNVERDMRTIAGVGNIESSATLVRKEVNIIPNMALAAEMGVTSAALTETLRVATDGDYESRLPKLNLPQRQIDMVIKLKEDGISDLETLKRLLVPGTKGPVLLAEIADLQYSSGIPVLERIDRERQVTLNVELASIALGDMVTAVKELPSIRNLPTNVQTLELGDAAEQENMAKGFAIAMLTGILCIYIILVVLFKRFLHPITILAALPLCFGGAFMALLITDKILGMPSLIGLLMLMGIATKNSILLVDYAIIARKAGKDCIESILDACHKRARPIIMTSIAMGAGMLPIALGWSSADPSFRSPMAIAVIGGLITSTLLSLLVIPAIYTIVEDTGEKVKRLWKNTFKREAY